MTQRPASATRASLASDLARLGLRPGDAVLAHAAVSRVGWLAGGPGELVGALLDAVSPNGTVLAYTDWDGAAPFDPARSPAIPDNGVLPEAVRRWPGAHRSASPGASVAAIGARAEWFTAGHPLDYGYGPGSPLAKLVEADGRVVMIGAPLDTMTLLHHAEHLADLPGKRVIRYEVALADGNSVHSRMVEEFDTADPVVAGFAEDYFGAIVADFLGAAAGSRGAVGGADAVLVDAAPMCAFAVGWMERAARAW